MSAESQLRQLQMQDDASLRGDVRALGELLGKSLIRQEGQELFDLVEKVRAAVRSGHGEAELKDVTVNQAVQLVRAFSTYFHLANVAEQVHRSRVLDNERSESGSWIAQAVDKIEAAKKSGHEIQLEDLKHWLADFSVRPVFTAHPTEAARRSVLSKMNTIADLLDEKQTARRDRKLSEMIDLLWETDELRLGQPEPLDEAVNALFYLDDLFALTIPEVLDDFARELERLGLKVSPTARPLSFGTWIGGDRDGNPNITPQVTKNAIVLQTGHFIRAMLAMLDELRQALSVSTRISGVSKELVASVERDLSLLPEIEDRFRRINAEEPYRLKATAIRHRLILTQRRHAAGGPHVDNRDYKNTEQLLADLTMMHRSLVENRGELIAHGLLERIIRTVACFGLTHATMDVREHSGAHHEALAEIEKAGVEKLTGTAEKTFKTFVAIRELIEETNVRVPEKVLRGSIVKTELFDSTNRSFGIPRNTMAVYMRISPNPDYSLPRANGADDAALCKWVPLTDALNSIEMYDDHAAIISKVTGVMPMPAFSKSA